MKKKPDSSETSKSESSPDPTKKPSFWSRLSKTVDEAVDVFDEAAGLKEPDKKEEKKRLGKQD